MTKKRGKKEKKEEKLKKKLQKDVQFESAGRGGTEYSAKAPRGL